MRLFVAILLSEEMRSALVSMQDDMRFQRVVGNYSPPENLHLTLAFIGDYPDPEDVPLPEFKPFELKLSGYGSFGELWWAGLEKSHALEACVRRLRRGLAEAGKPFDRKRFAPHITLVRRAEGRPTLEVPSVSMTVKRISLMRSERGRHGMIYTEIRGRDASEA